MKDEPKTAAHAHSSELVRLHLGCGHDYRIGWINLDVPGADVRADVFHDLNASPWPFNDASVDHIEMHSVIEHLDDTLKTLEECWRILKPKGRVSIYAPYFKSDDAFLDPTHRRFFDPRTFRFITDGDAFNFYTRARFNIVEARYTSQWDTVAKVARNLIPFRNVLARFLWNMYDGVQVTLEKPQ